MLGFSPIGNVGAIRDFTTKKATQQGLEGGKITLAAEKEIKERGGDNKRGIKTKNSYNDIAEKSQEGLSDAVAGSMEGYNVDSGDINEIESTGLGDQLYQNQLHLAQKELERVAQQLPAQRTSFSHGLYI